MLTQKFMHFHLHTDGSHLDGMNDLPHLFKRLKEIGHNVVAVTDHGGMYNALSLYKKAIEEGMKPVIGCEFYMFHDHTLQSKEDIEARVEEEDDTFIRDETHLVVLAKDFKGYQNLCRLSSKGFSEGFYRRPHIDFNQLIEHKEGLIVIEGHVGTTVARLIERGEIERAYAVSERLKREFGDDFYLEIQNHGLEIEKIVNPVVVQIADDLEVTLVASTDAHYTTREDAMAHRVLFANGIKKTYAAFIQGPYEGFTTCDEFYVKSDDEMLAAMAEYGDVAIQAVYNTMQLAEKCNLEIPHIEYGGSFVNAKGKTEHKWKTVEHFFPNFEIPVPFASPGEYLRYLGRKGLEERKEAGELYGMELGKHTYFEYEERFDFEMGVITNMGFPTYFLILEDMVKFCIANGIPVGKGRGSGAGSLVLYCLRITDVDPMQYDLLFERFLSVDRISLPDVDMDIDMYRISEVIEYLKDKYGWENVAKIGTFGTLGAKAVLKDVARVLEYPFDKINAITKSITDISITIEEAMEKYKNIHELYEEDDEFKRVIDIAKRLEGLQRHTSQHAAGIVISPFPLTDILPLKGKPDDLVTQFAMGEVELLGLVKMDLLKLRTLTIAKNALKSIERHTGKNVDINRIDFDDDRVFEEFQKGNTTGIFQFESDGMKALLRGMKPKSIADLASANGLYRPGPLDCTVTDPDSPHFGKTMVEVYVERASGRAEVTYDHPLLEEAQKTTFGVFVFQEQIMRSSVILAGHSKAESDALRKVVAKKLEDKMPVEKEKFIQGCLNNPRFIEGCGNRTPLDIASRIWEQIETFGRYGFNLSHSVSYAILAYQSMYLKVYYPTHFMAAVLSSWMGKKVELIIPYLNECRSMGIEILPPDINHSTDQFEASRDEKGIHFGLTGIKGVGEKAVDNILEVKANHEIRSMVDFVTMTGQTVNKTVVLALVKCGAFDFLGYNRMTLMKMAEDIISLNSKVKQRITNNKKRKNPVEDISTFYAPLYDYEPVILEDFTLQELCDMEKELTGFYMKHHPLEGVVGFIQAKSTHTSLEINKGIKVVAMPKPADPDEEILDGFYEENIEAEEMDDEETYQPLPAGRTVITGGVVKEVKEIIVKNGRSKGQTMASFVIEDAYQGDIRCTVFADKYGRYRNTVRAGNVIFIDGSVDYYRESAQINVRAITEVSRDVANRYNQTKLIDELNSELVEIQEEIALIEETMAALGPEDADLISDICEELLGLYERKDEIIRQKEALAA